MRVSGIKSRVGKNGVFGSATINRRVPRNSRYEDVRSTIDTGSTINKVKFISTREFLRKKGELFRRVNVRTLAAMLEESEVQDESIFNMGAAEDKLTTVEADAKAEDEKPYLLLDVRSEDEYTACHISGAKSFPAVLLRHDKMTRELWRIKNREGHVVIVYDRDEREAAACATQFMEKGYDNVIMLSGGLKGFAAHLGGEHLVGQPSEELLGSPEKSPSRRTGTASTYSGRTGRSPRRSPHRGHGGMSAAGGGRGGTSSSSRAGGGAGGGGGGGRGGVPSLRGTPRSMFGAAGGGPSTARSVAASGIGTEGAPSECGTERSVVASVCNWSPKK